MFCLRISRVIPTIRNGIFILQNNKHQINRLMIKQYSHASKVKEVSSCLTSLVKSQKQPACLTPMLPFNFTNSLNYNSKRYYLSMSLTQEHTVDTKYLINELMRRNEYHLCGLKTLYTVEYVKLIRECFHNDDHFDLAPMIGILLTCSFPVLGTITIITDIITYSYKLITFPIVYGSNRYKIWRYQQYTK